jgi:HlyD family secretion protein
MRSIGILLWLDKIGLNSASARGKAPGFLDPAPKKRFLIARQTFMSSPIPSLSDLRIERSAKPVSRKRIWPIVVSLAVLLLLVAGGVFWFTRPKPIEVHTIAARALATGSAADHTVLNASGYVTARRQATVSSKVTGKVVEILVEEGLKVQEGQVLARLDDTNVRASLLLAQAQLASSKAGVEETRVRIKESELNLARITSLASKNISAQADLEHAEADAAAFKAKLQQQMADIEVAQKNISAWQQQLDDTVIRAPFAGIVTSKNAQPGEMISPISAGGGFTRTGICTLVDMESLEIEIDVNESYIGRVSSGQPVESTLDAYPDWKIPCKVIAIIPTADRQKSTVKVRVGFVKTDPRILPEMSIKVAFHESAGDKETISARGVAVPKTAVQDQEGRKVVMVVHDGRAERRNVTIEREVNEEAIIGAGVAAGERVITEWSGGLADGAPVKEATAEK